MSSETTTTTEGAAMDIVEWADDRPYVLYTEQRDYDAETDTWGPWGDAADAEEYDGDTVPEPDLDPDFGYTDQQFRLRLTNSGGDEIGVSEAVAGQMDPADRA